jgi:hypothetical protein
VRTIGRTFKIVGFLISIIFIGMKIQITENQLQNVIKETIGDDNTKSEAVYLPDFSKFKFETLESQGLKAYMFNKQLVELKPIETYKDIPKFDSNKRSWASNHILLLTNKDFNIFNELANKTKTLIELEEQKLKLYKEHVQAVIYERLKK